VQYLPSTLSTKQEFTVKKILLLFLAIFLTGCGVQYPLTTKLDLQHGMQPTRIYFGNTLSATLKGHDARTESAVVIYRQKGKPAVELPNETAPHVLITERLAAGLQEQGLSFQRAAPIRIQLDLNELVATVSRTKILYSITAKSRLVLTIKNSDITLTKTYSREANRDAATRPAVQDLEKLLNSQLTDIVNQILQDAEIQDTIGKI
jgi:uncharacterized lipoprotein